MSVISPFFVFCMRLRFLGLVGGLGGSELGGLLFNGWTGEIEWINSAYLI